MNQKIKDEYYFLTEKLDEVIWALEGKCDDIDCDKFMYKDLLKKRYKPIIDHKASCIKNLKTRKEAIMRLLSLKKFRKLRYIKCNICKRNLDELSNKSTIVSYMRPTPDKKFYEYVGVWAHKSCGKKVKIPEGWKKFI